MSRNATTLALLTLAGVAGPAVAQVANIGFVDWRENYNPGWLNDIEIATAINDHNSQHWLEDHAVINPGGGGQGRGFDGAGIAYFTSGTNDIPSDLVMVTTIYGLDLTPDDRLPALTGQDINDPIFEFTSLETIIGISGTEYNSDPVQAVQLGDLGPLLPGKDLSWFDSGDPASHLWVFQTIAPLNDFYVPTPASAALLGLGSLALTRRRW